MARLFHYGFASEKRRVEVLVENSKTGLYKPSLGLSISDFIALLAYAVETGKPSALALKNVLINSGENKDEY